MQVDRLLSASKTSPAETRSNNSGRYALLKSRIPCIHLPVQWPTYHWLNQIQTDFCAVLMAKMADSWLLDERRAHFVNNCYNIPLLITVDFPYVLSPQYPSNKWINFAYRLPFTLAQLQWKHRSGCCVATPGAVAALKAMAGPGSVINISLSGVCVQT